VVSARRAIEIRRRRDAAIVVGQNHVGVREGRGSGKRSVWLMMPMVMAWIRGFYGRHGGCVCLQRELQKVCSRSQWERKQD